MNRINSVIKFKYSYEILLGLVLYYVIFRFLWLTPPRYDIIVAQGKNGFIASWMSEPIKEIQRVNYYMVSSNTGSYHRVLRKPIIRYDYYENYEDKEILEEIRRNDSEAYSWLPGEYKRLDDELYYLRYKVEEKTKNLIVDMTSMYRMNYTTHNISRISLDTYAPEVLGRRDIDGMYSFSRSDVERLAYLDKYRGLSEAISENVLVSDLNYETLHHKLIVTEYSFISNLDVINDRIFFGSGEKLYEYNPNDGKVKYITRFPFTNLNPKRFSVIGVAK